MHYSIYNVNKLEFEVYISVALKKRISIKFILPKKIIIKKKMGGKKWKINIKGG